MFQYKILIVFKVLIVSSLLVAGSLLLINNEISIGQFVAAEIIIILVVNSVEKIILSLETVYDTLTAFEKIGQIMDLPLEMQSGTEKSLSPEKTGLKFDIQNLSFKAKSSDDEILNNVSLSLQPGEKIVLTGGSGSGKSTLMNLMAGLYSDYRGKIIINGLPIDTMDLSKFRSFVGDSLTHESIFSGTIRENIELGREIEENFLREIIELVGLNKYVYELPADLETELMPEGKGLSKAIVSSIIMARCLIGQPKVLFLEALFSDFAPEVKERVKQYISAGQWTVMMISDDLEIIKLFPRVIELEKGSVIFDGKSTDYIRLKNY